MASLSLRRIRSEAGTGVRLGLDQGHEQVCGRDSGKVGPGVRPTQAFTWAQQQAYMIMIKLVLRVNIQVSESREMSADSADNSERQVCWYLSLQNRTFRP